MSLQFVMGPSGSGKSHYLYQKVTEESLKHPDKNYFVIVPEQFTMQTQKDLVMASPKRGIMNVDVLSFNRLAYRIARRDAHNRDAELASVVSNMSSEPNVTPQIREAAFRLLCLNHTFTSYISALGAHREQLTNPEILAFLDEAVCYVDDALHHQPADEERVNEALASLKQRMQQLEPRADSKEPLVVQQVGLLIALLPEIGRLQRQITQVPQETPVSA